MDLSVPGALREQVARDRPHQIRGAERLDVLAGVEWLLERDGQAQRTQRQAGSDDPVPAVVDPDRAAHRGGRRAVIQPVRIRLAAVGSVAVVPVSRMTIAAISVVVMTVAVVPVAVAVVPVAPSVQPPPDLGLGGCPEGDRAIGRAGLLLNRPGRLPPQDLPHVVYGQQYVEQHARVDERHPLPRVYARYSSTVRPAGSRFTRPRMRLATEPAGWRLTRTSFPRSAMNWTSVSRVIPKRSRSAFGTVTCPLMVTRMTALVLPSS